LENTFEAIPFSTGEMAESADNTMTLSGFTTFDMGAVTTLDFDGSIAVTGGMMTASAGITVDDIVINANTITATAGVRLDDFIGINAVPRSRTTIHLGRTITATDSYAGLLFDEDVTFPVTASASVSMISGTSDFIAVNSANAINDVSGIRMKPFDTRITDGGTRTINNLAGLYIAGAPTITNTSGTITVTEGPYSIFVDAGDVRFDGNVGIGTTGPVYPLDVRGGNDITAELERIVV